MSGIFRLSEASTIAFHAAALLASNKGKSLTTRQISERLNVSAAHLSKVLQRLSKTGLVKSTRGPRGGFVLGREADSITLMELYEAIEGPPVLRACLFDESVCDGKKCIFGGVLGKMQKLFRDYLEGTRLSDLDDVFSEGGGGLFAVDTKK